MVWIAYRDWMGSYQVPARTIVEYECFVPALFATLFHQHIPRVRKAVKSAQTETSKSIPNNNHDQRVTRQLATSASHLPLRAFKYAVVPFEVTARRFSGRLEKPDTP